MKTYYLGFLLIFLCTSCSKYKHLDKSHLGNTKQLDISNDKDNQAVIDFLPSDFQLAHFHQKLKTFSLKEVLYKERNDGSISFKYGKTTNLEVKKLKEKNYVFISEADPHTAFFYSKSYNLLDVKMTSTYIKAEQYLVNKDLIAYKDSMLLENKAQQLKDSILLSYMEQKGDSLKIVYAKYSERQAFLKKMEQKLNDDISFLQLFIRKLQEKSDMLNSLSFQCALSLTFSEGPIDIFQETYQQLPNFPGHKNQRAEDSQFGYNKLHPISVQRLRKLRSYILHPERLMEDFKKKDFSEAEIEQVKSWTKEDKDPVHILIGAQNPIHQIQASKNKPLNNLDFFHLFGGAIQLNSATCIFSPYNDLDILKEDLSDYKLFVKIAEKSGFSIYASDLTHPKFKENHLNLIPVEFQNEQYLKGTPMAMKIGSQWMKKLDEILSFSITDQTEKMAMQSEKTTQADVRSNQLLETISTNESALESLLSEVEQLSKENYTIQSAITDKENIVEVQRKKVVLLENQNFDKQNKVFTNQINDLRRTIKSFLGN